MQPKERIVEQAMQMFVSQGLKSVRMDDIAQQLGVSKRTLYELFGDKEELLFQALLLYFTQCEEHHNQLAAKADNVLHAMYLVLSDVMDHSMSHNRMMTNLQKFYPTVLERLRRLGDEEHRRSFRECLERGIADGLFLSDINLELSISVLYYTASALFSVQGGVPIPKGMSEHDAFAQIVNSFFRGISTAKGIALIDAYAAEHILHKKHE